MRRTWIPRTSREHQATAWLRTASANGPREIETIRVESDGAASARDRDWIDVRCGACGKPMMVTFAWLGDRRTVDCPDCLASIDRAKRSR